MEGVRETAVGSPGGGHETITLQAETRTPRARTLSASFVRERTPLGELPPARRQRKKNEGKGRARALGRLDPLKHEQYREAERTRKKDAALRAARGEQVVRRTRKRSAMALDAAWGDVDGSLTTAGLPSSPPWKQQARERVAAVLQAAEQRKDERAAAGQKLREWRAALVPSARCGSCATCTQLIRFGGSKVRNAGFCEAVLSRLGADPCAKWQALWGSDPNSEIRVAFTCLDT